jgi:hypothetical protein
MNIRTLKKNLPEQVRVTRESRKIIRVEAQGLTYRVDDRAGTAEEAAALLRSKIPIMGIPPRS